MSCNPAMGGIAKGQIVREIDALGGYSGIVSDTSAIQFKMLNKSKGPAMWSPRVQSDRMRFAEDWRMLLEQTENLDFPALHMWEVEDGKQAGERAGRRASRQPGRHAGRQTSRQAGQQASKQSVQVYPAALV